MREVGGSHYLAFGVRNVGAGIAVLHSWQLAPADGSADADKPDVSRFRRHTRDIYVASGDLGFWQAAIRDADDEFRAVAEDLIGKRQVFAIDIMYGDYEGGQHTVSRFSIAPLGDDRWLSRPPPLAPRPRRPPSRRLTRLPAPTNPDPRMFCGNGRYTATFGASYSKHAAASEGSGRCTGATRHW